MISEPINTFETVLNFDQILVRLNIVIFVFFLDVNILVTCYTVQDFINWD